MVDDDSFADDMARELDAAIRMLVEQESLLAAAIGAERVCELEEYFVEILDGSAGQVITEFERWLDSRDIEWISVVARLRHVRIQRATLGRLCMQTNTRHD
ncbi:MAG: hypothetical protein WA123_10430 [Methylotenera sp.]